MGQEIYRASRKFRSLLDDCDRALRSHLERPLLDVMFATAGDLLQPAEYAHARPICPAILASRTLELVRKTLGQMLDETAARFPDRDALIYVDRSLRYTYRERRDRVELLARGLLALGIEKGEHISLWATNIPEWVLLQFATAKIGAILVTININYQRHELKYVLGQSDSSTLFLMKGFRDVDYVAAVRDVVPEALGSEWPERPSKELPGLRRLVYLGEGEEQGMLPFERLFELGRTVELESPSGRACRPCRRPRAHRSRSCAASTWK